MLAMFISYLVEYNIDFSFSNNTVYLKEIDTGFYGVHQNQVQYNKYNDGCYNIEYYNKGYYQTENFNDVKDLIKFICKLEGVYFEEETYNY